MSDSYLAACNEQGDGQIATMSVIDLSKVDKVVETFNTFAKRMYDSSENSVTFSKMSRLITKIDNFGGNNKSEGYTNMVDYGGLLTACSEYAAGSEEPQVDDDGVYYFVLDDEGYENTADVIAYVYTPAEDGERYIEMGETYDLEEDWDEGYFADAFDGHWLSLPDGQNLATYIVDTTDDYVIYSSPILLNDEETNLRIRQTYDGAVMVEGAWDGIGSNGVSSRNIVKDIGAGHWCLTPLNIYKRRNMYWRIMKLC